MILQPILQMLLYFFFTAVFPISVNCKSIMAIVRPKILAAILNSSLSLQISNPSPNPVSSIFKVFFRIQPPLDICLLCSAARLPSLPLHPSNLLTHFIINTAARVSLSVAKKLSTCFASHSAWKPEPPRFDLSWHYASFLLLSTCPIPLSSSSADLPLSLHTRHPRTESPAQVVLCVEGSFPRGTWSPSLFFFRSLLKCYFTPDASLTLPLLPPCFHYLLLYL